jgi:hypothetical protein
VKNKGSVMQLRPAPPRTTAAAGSTIAERFGGGSQPTGEPPHHLQTVDKFLDVMASLMQASNKRPAEEPAETSSEAPQQKRRKKGGKRR